MNALKHFLTLDVGTTCCKAQVFDEKGNILFYKTENCALTEWDNTKAVDIEHITETVKTLIYDAAHRHVIHSIAVSSLGEAFVLLDKNDNLLSYPMLYTDTRGSKQADKISDCFGKDKIFAVTGTVPDAMYSVSKLLWLKENRGDLYAKADKLLLICDYIGYILTGRRVIDYGLAARTGIFDIRAKKFSADITDRLGIDIKLFSDPMPTGSVVGEILPGAAKELGLPHDCVLVLGSHDQVCAAVGAGVIHSGETADGMGTVECITAVFDTPPSNIGFGGMGYCVVPFPGDNYCTYMFNYTSNALINWYRREILHGYKGTQTEQFSYLEQSDSPTDILCLPYFAGCATPYCDKQAKGAFLNLTQDSRDTDIYRAILESTSFEMKLNTETILPYGIRIQSLTATGGGANSNMWLQIKSDIFGLPVQTLRSSEGGLCGLAVLSAVAMGTCGSTDEAKKIFVQYKHTFFPKKTHKDIYAEKYAKYKKLYHLLKEFF